MATAKRTPGRIVWHVLLSPEMNDSAAFYGQLFGWVAEPERDGPRGPYRRLLNVDRTPIGGIMHGEEPGWLPFANVPDVQAAEQAAVGAGGSPRERFEVPSVGQAAILEDRGGAPFVVWCAQIEEPRDSGGARPLGSFCWDELHASKPRASAAFYRAVLGLKPVPLKPDDPDFYTFLERGPRRCDGAVRRSDRASPDCWAPKVRVRAADRVVATAEGLGAVLLDGPTSTPGGREAHLRDPLGARFGVVA